jgi:hypothetical protein
MKVWDTTVVQLEGCTNTEVTWNCLNVAYERISRCVEQYRKLVSEQRFRELQEERREFYFKERKKALKPCTETASDDDVLYMMGGLHERYENPYFRVLLHESKIPRHQWHQTVIKICPVVSRDMLISVRCGLSKSMPNYNPLLAVARNFEMIFKVCFLIALLNMFDQRTSDLSLCLFLCVCVCVCVCFTGMGTYRGPGCES